MFQRLKRLISPSYRRGLAAESRGELDEAAAHFARAGLPTEVFRARLTLARRQDDPQQRLHRLSDALEVAAVGRVDAAVLRGPRLELGRALLEAGDEAERDRAIELLVAAGEVEEAAEHLLGAGDFAAARRLLERERRFERLEIVDQAEARRRSRDGRSEAALAEALACQTAGRRREAEERWLALERDPEIDEETRQRAARERESLVQRRLAGRARLRAEDGRVVILLAGLPTVLGRGEESPLPLADPGVSRRHARLLREGEGLALEDLESRNGTLIDGVPLAGRMILGATGRFSLGDSVRIRWELGPPALLELERGLAAGTRCVFLREGEGVSLELLFPGAGTSDEVGVKLERGRFLLTGGRSCRLEGLPLEPPGRVEIADGDSLDWPSLRLGVSRG